jgi:hypothetical protein
VATENVKILIIITIFHKIVIGIGNLSCFPFLCLGAGYTYAILCAICCKSLMRFAASAIWCPTRNRYRLHKACDIVLRFAVRYCVAICCAIWPSSSSSCLFLGDIGDDRMMYLSCHSCFSRCKQIRRKKERKKERKKSVTL